MCFLKMFFGLLTTITAAFYLVGCASERKITASMLLRESFLSTLNITVSYYFPQRRMFQVEFWSHMAFVPVSTENIAEKIDFILLHLDVS